MLTSFKIAIRFLRRSQIQTMIIILSIAIGVSVQIFIGLLSKSLEKDILNKVVGNLVHISIKSNENNIKSWQSVKEKIKGIDTNINTIAPVVEKHVFINRNNKKENVLVRGFLPENIDTLYDMTNKIYEGKMINENSQALIGKDLKDKLKLNLGENIDIVTLEGKKIQLTVVGCYDLGAVKINSMWLITDLKTAKDLSGIEEDQVTSIEVSVKDAYNADYIGDKIQKSLNDKSLKVENWKEENQLLSSAMIGQKICSSIIQFFVLLAATLSIISILNISVVQKYKQIGILKAMGIKDSSAGLVFLIQAFILGMIGSGVGIILTVLYINGFNRFIVTSDGKPVVNIIISNKFIIKSLLIAIAASTFSAIFSALKSFKLNPVEVIKNG